MAPVRSGTLYLVATPIGNLEDISLRALRILREVTVVAAEDTRRTRKLLTHHGIHARLISLHEHNERTRTPVLLARLQEGQTVAVVSDAGTPGLSDPGTGLVRAAAEAGVAVVSVPGPSAFLSALVASGLRTAPVTFLGFLPDARGERQRALQAVRPLPHTLVVYESPHRLAATLRALLEVLGDRRVAVAREMTKIHEEVVRGRLHEAIQHFSDHTPQGEFTLVIEGAPARSAGVPSPAPSRDDAAGISHGESPADGRPAGRHDLPGEDRQGSVGHTSEGELPAGTPEEAAAQAREQARAVLRVALAEKAAPFEAVRRAARASGLRRNEVYRLWLALKQEGMR